jgi:restriction endonuclease S subunit
LSRKIKDISENSSVGSAMPSIGRAELERFEVPLPPLNKQIAIGEIWEKSIEKKKMYIRLAQLENIKENYMINKLINGEKGGVSNDHI